MSTKRHGRICILLWIPELWKEFCLRLQKNGKIEETEFKTYFDKNESELDCLPWHLGDYRNDIRTLRAKAFYKHIPWQKQLELMSALTLRHWLKETLKCKYLNGQGMFVVGDVNIDNYYDISNE